MRFEIQPLRALAFLAVVSAGAAVTACGASADDAGDDALASLTREVREQRRQNEALIARIDRLERRIDGHSQDLDRLSRTGVEAALKAADVAPASEDDPEGAVGTGTPAPVAEKLAELLETEDGQAAVEKAMAAIQERRDAERRERWIGSMVDRFATEANLTDAQSRDVRQLMTRSFKQIGEVWSGIRDADVSDDQRAILREEAMVKMEEIRQQTSEEMKAVLTSDQFAIYEELSGRMRGFGGRGGDRGGRGR